MSDIGLLPQIGETPNMEEFPLSGNSSTLTSHLALLDYWSQPARPCWMWSSSDIEASKCVFILFGIIYIWLCNLYDYLENKRDIYLFDSVFVNME